MKKSEQIKINEKVLRVAETYLCETPHGRIYPKGKTYRIERFRNCNACVWVNESGYFLQSYATIVAFIPYRGGDCYDFLRYIYGYTATSAKQISNYARDYGNGTILSWKEV